MIAIAPASFDIYLSVRINYIQNWCGLLLLYLYYRQCEKPVNKIKQIQFPHLFYLLIFPEGDRENNFSLMNSFLFEGILFFYILFSIVPIYAQQQNLICWGSKEYKYTRLEYTIMDHNITSIN